MSAALLDLASIQSPADIGSESRRSRSTFPIGARFPRQVGDAVAAPANHSTPNSASAPAFPVGARFPRRSAAEILGYLADMERRAESVASISPAYPVGARFPLR